MNSYKTLLDQAQTQSEKEGLYQLFKMMISLRQQKLLREKFKATK